LRINFDAEIRKNPFDLRRIDVAGIEGNSIKINRVDWFARIRCGEAAND